VPDQAARKTQSVDFGHLSDILAFLGGGRFLTLFLSFFLDFNFITFLTFAFFCFVDFFTFYIFSILMILMFCDFWSIFVIFLVDDQILSLFVSVLGASIMTHFYSGKPALPLSPFLVVKLWPILIPQFVINFEWFLSDFYVILINFDEKLDFAIKKHTF